MERNYNEVVELTKTYFNHLLKRLNISVLVFSAAQFNSAMVGTNLQRCVVLNGSLLEIESLPAFIIGGALGSNTK